jgi:hypothetical protein
MMTLRDTRTLSRITVALYWGCIVFGLTLPGIITVVHDASRGSGGWADAWQDFHLHLFAPGYNLFLVGVLNALPFAVLAVFLLFHLGTAPPHGPVIVARRLAGIIGAWLAAFGLSLWLHLTLTLHPDAQGAIALFFLPFYMLLLMPVGYGCGRLIGKIAARSS